ncbi:MAG: DUF3078 domain-containing protein [Bdellovibrionales bacterium]|nr:DUF3078 domain-containing protein [Bdellovibrionales bacterium]
MMLSRFIITLIATPLILATQAKADETSSETYNFGSRSPQSLVKEDGWSPVLNLGANISFGSSDKVIGQKDGDSKTFGANIDGAMNYKKENKEWQNELKYKGATSRTPAIDQYIKSSDELSLTSAYLYGLEAYPWLGPYARVNAKSALFKGEDVRSDVVTYEKQTRENVTQETVTGKSVRLTDGLKPMTVKESVGFFAKWIEKEKLKLTTRLGLGALQVDAAGQYIVKDNDTTTNIELQELDSYKQQGIEGGLSLEGLIDEKTKYSLTIDFLTPIGADLPASDKRNDFDLTNIETVFKLTSKVYEWMAFNYEFSLKREPQLLNENQVQHLMSLNFSYSLF